MSTRPFVCVSALAFAFAACGGSSETPLFGLGSPGFSPDAGDAGIVDGAVPVDTGTGPTGDATTAFTCDGDPALDARILTEACGVFAAPPRLGGGDERAGTRAQPVARVQRALDVAQKLGRRWAFVCASEFTESVVMGAEHAGVRVYGALACPDESAPWTNAPGRHARIVQPSDAPANSAAWRVEGIGVPVVLQAVEIVAKDASVASASSIALSALRVATLELRDSKVVAGKGADGAPGAFGVEGKPLAMGRILAVDAVDAVGGRSDEFDCNTGGHTRGGEGGTASESAGPTQNGGGGLPLGQVGLGGSSKACIESMTGGLKGVDGHAGSAGRGALLHGALTTGTWLPAAGGRGTEGTVGQGGGGGGAGTYEVVSTFPATKTAGGGGAGGPGGCGGGGGEGGSGGGASLAVLVVDAHVVATRTTLLSGPGGGGGAGGRGHAGVNQQGPGSLRSGTGCWGGFGGKGGDGGRGGGGAGGISIGVLASASSQTTLDAATVAASAAGVPGGGGPGEGTSGIGVAGIAQLTLTTTE